MQYALVHGTCVYKCMDAWGLCARLRGELVTRMPGHRSKHSLRHAGPSHDHFLRNSSSTALAVWRHFDRSMGYGVERGRQRRPRGCNAFQSVRRSVGKLGKPKTACTFRQEVKYSPCVGLQVKQTSSAMASSSRRLRDTEEKTSLLQPELSSQQVPLCLPSLLSCPAPPGNSVSSVKRAVHMQPILLEVFRPMLACATVDTHMAIDE